MDEATVAHRSEQEPFEPSESPGADDQNLRFFGCAQERSCREIVHDLFAYLARARLPLCMTRSPRSTQAVWLKRSSSE